MCAGGAACTDYLAHGAESVGNVGAGFAVVHLPDQAVSVCLESFARVILKLSSSTLLGKSTAYFLRKVQLLSVRSSLVRAVLMGYFGNVQI